jgi:L-asparaginase
MTSSGPDGQGVRPSLSVEQLLAAVPGLDDIAEVRATTLNTLPGASLTLEDVIQALKWARAEVADGAAGAVVIQGTDTIEETAYLLDLYWDSPAPLVVTGAMRPPQLPGADGPANLVASVRVAADDASRQRGVLIVLNDEIHGARWARKMRASGPDAFASPSFGPLGYVDERRPAYGTVLDVIAASGFSGVVLAGFGVGHVSGQLACAAQRAAASIPVVLASRTGAGSTHRNSYSFDGSESDLIAKGAIPAGWLDARKSRVLLACLLAGGTTTEDIRAEFEHRGKLL